MARKQRDWLELLICFLGGVMIAAGVVIVLSSMVSCNTLKDWRDLRETELRPQPWPESLVIGSSFGPEFDHRGYSVSLFWDLPDYKSAGE